MASSTLPASLFQSLVHFAPDGILVADRDGIIVFASAQAEQLFGYAREDLVGSPVERLIPERLRDGHRQLRDGYARSPHARPMGVGLALMARRRDHSEFAVEVSLAPVYTDHGMFIAAIVRDVSAQRDLERARRHLEAEAEIERERNRIAADLHDGVMQTMYSVGLQLSSFLRRSTTVNDLERTGIEQTIGELNQAIEDVRRYVQALHPAEFDGDLRSSLDGLVRLFAVTSGIDASFESDIEVCQLDPGRGFELFLLAREALSNSSRHAQATTVSVTLREADDEIVLVIHDNGIGFDSDAPSPDGHYGLHNMRSRAVAAGATLGFESGNGFGTDVRVRVPTAPIG